MVIEGTLAHNLRAAIRSAGRIQGRRVYKDTIEFWSDMSCSSLRVQAQGSAKTYEPRLNP
jgi:hypothetical protein